MKIEDSVQTSHIEKGRRIEIGIELKNYAWPFFNKEEYLTNEFVNLFC